MSKLIKNISSLVTVNSKGKLFKKGNELQDAGEIKDGAILFDKHIIWTGTTFEAEKKLVDRSIIPDEIIDAGKHAVLPGFVDSHTHIVFAGNRADEFAKRLKGASYSEIAAEGGGILATVKAVRNASIDELVDNGRKIAISAINHGTTAIEIKSGYGLTTNDEIKMLKAIKILNDELPLNISSTFLGAHDFPPEYKNDRDKYVDIICNEMLTKVADEGLAEFCDAFIDQGYYTLEQGKKIFDKAQSLGLKIKVHADELANVEAAGFAADIGAITAEHLLCISDKGIEKMKDSNIIATLLPGTAYFIRMPYAPARKLIDSGVITALATDCNPGSCFTENMQTILSLAVINMKMTAEEAITAATLNGAAALCKSDTMGSLEAGKLANFIILDSSSYTDMFYHFGINHVQQVWIEGKRII